MSSKREWGKEKGKRLVFFKSIKTNSWFGYFLKWVKTYNQDLLLLKRNPQFFGIGSTWENNLPVSVLISFISPLIECEKSHLAIVLSLVQCLLRSFFIESDKRMFALSLPCLLVQLKAFQEGGEQAGRLPGYETLSRPIQEHWINFQYVSSVAKPILWGCYCLIRKSRRNVKRDSHATVINSFCL